MTAFIDRMANAHSLTSAVRFVAFVSRKIRRQFKLLPRIISGADLVIGSSLVFGLSSIAEAMGIRYRYIAFTPQLLPSEAHPFPAFRHQRRPHWFNRLTWGLARMADHVYLDRVVAAARHAGQRLVIGRFWEATSKRSDAGDIFYISKYPHLHLFPRMAAVIHHGGAGTTAVSARCGIPQIVVPHVLDQYYLGERVYRTALGPEPIRRSRLTARGLTTAIEASLNDQRIHKCTEAIAREIGRVDGLATTVREIENGVTR